MIILLSGIINILRGMVCHWCQRHRWQMEKTFKPSNLQYKFLPSSSLYGICSLILLPLFAAGVADTGGKFANLTREYLREFSKKFETI